MDSASKNHSKFLLLSHLIGVWKDRKNLLLLYGDETKKIFEGIAVQANFSCETMEVDQDHIHCLVKSEARISPLAIVRRLKQPSALEHRLVHECDLKRHFWKERTFWSDGYFCGTLGNASQETIRQYMQVKAEPRRFIHEAEDFVVFSPP